MNACEECNYYTCFLVARFVGKSNLEAISNIPIPSKHISR